MMRHGGRLTIHYPPLSLGASLRVTMLALIVILAARSAPADSPTPLVDELIRHSANGVVMPNEPLPNDLIVKCVKATHWKVGNEYRLLAEGDVALAIGSYGFKARRVMIHIIPTPGPGPVNHQLAIYLDQVTELGGHGPISADAPRLLVTAVISGGVKFDAAGVSNTAPAPGSDPGSDPASDDLVAAADQRIARYFDNVARNTVALKDTSPLFSKEVLARSQAPAPGIPALETRNPTASTAALRLKPETPSPAPGIPPTPETRNSQPKTPSATPTAGQPIKITPAAASALHRVYFSAGKIVVQDGKDEGYILLVGNVQVMYHEPDTGRSVTLQSDRAVIFTAPGILNAGNRELDAQTVRGVYLEDNVIATDGSYTMRGPRVFYDLIHQRAVVLEAVFYTWDIKQQIPIYVRARKLMQMSDAEWRSSNARLSTSEFFEPQFSLGMNKLTVTKEQRAEGDSPAYRYVGQGATINLGPLPVFYWPGFSGDITQSPLKKMDVNYNTRNGMIVKSRWDAFALANTQSPDGVEATLLVDAYTNRAGATGLELNYDVPKAFGRLDSYLMYDVGEDEPGGRESVEPEDNFRGMAHWQHRHYLPAGWEASLELGYLSDPTFLEEYFAEHAYTDKPWETSIYLKKQQDDWAFTFLTKYDLLDFAPQLTQLQTPGYTVDKLPELAYYRVGTPLLGDKLTWFSENRASALRMNFPTQTPRQLGFSAAESLALFGMANTARFDDALQAGGLDDNTVIRLDSRQELDLPLKLGPIDIVPYLAGRVTTYDHDFSAYNSGRDDDNHRLWGQSGIKLHTAFSNTFDNAESELLDIHRLRHIIEPSANLSYAAATINQTDLPVYDYNVESLAEGTQVRLGLRNTLQTQRGGPDHWQSVDVFRLDTDFILDEGHSQSNNPLARFFDYRPEYSLTGDHFFTEAAWQVTDALATVANMNYSLERDRIERWNLGIIFDHNPRLTSWAQLRNIEAIDSLIFQYGFDYLLSPKYHLSFSQAIDITRGRSREVAVVVTRRMPRMLLLVAFSFDPIDDSTSAGIALAPEGFAGKGNVGRNPFLFPQ